MFLPRKPPVSRIEEFLVTQRKEDFSYSEVGATRTRPPSGYVVDHNRVRLGFGERSFHHAKELLNAWRMFDLGWIEVFPRNLKIAPGATVAVMIHHFGFWSLNACRIIYLVDEGRRYGFAYGTLQDHAEQGEERFSIEWLDDDSVWYDILAFSRPRQWQARMAGPISRMLQRRFAHDSKAAMMK